MRKTRGIEKKRERKRARARERERERERCHAGLELDFSARE